MRFLALIMISFWCLIVSSVATIAATNTETRIIASEKFLPKQKGSAFYYSRAKITIIRKSLQPVPPAPEPLPWLDKSIQDRPIIQPPPPPEPYPPLVLDVEIRDAETLYKQKGWFSFDSYPEQSGVMMVFSSPSTSPIIRSAQYATTDILFIDKHGKITQIVPNISLSSLEQDIHPSSPILAFLFLKGESYEKLAINVGDEVQYSLFKKPPTILNAPKEKGQKETPKDNQQLMLNKPQILP